MVACALTTAHCVGGWIGFLIAAGWVFVLQPRLRYRRARRHALGRTASSEVINAIAQCEDPMLYRLSLEFALFRTYAIPSISKLLDATGEFRLRTCRRYDDTDLILRELTENGVRSARGEAAVGRLNCIHAQHVISNEDYVYTLSVFVLEPQRFFERWGWRKYARAERVAAAAMWREIGLRMGIKNVPETFEAFQAVNEAFEARHMTLAASNARVGDPTIALMLSTPPAAWISRLLPRGISLKCCVVALMDERLRLAMGYESAPAHLACALDAVLKLRAAVFRHLLPPRFTEHRRTRPEVEREREPLSGGSWGDRVARAAQEPRRAHFHIYGKTYKDGYTIDTLGPPQAPTTARAKKVADS